MAIKSIIWALGNKIPGSRRVLGLVETHRLEDTVEPQTIEENVNGSTKDRIHSRIIQNRRKSLAEDDTTLTENSSSAEFSDTRDDFREQRVKQYLNDQNKKFNELINKNFDVFIRQQRFDESEQYVGGGLSFSQLNKGRFQFIFGDKKQVGPEEMATLINEGKIPLNELVQLLDEDAKYCLFAVLRKDDHIHGDIVNHIDSYLPDDASVSEKLQATAILLVRLFFVATRMVVPILQLMYLKIANNELFLINERNVNKFLTYTIRALEKAEKKLGKSLRKKEQEVNSTVSGAYRYVASQTHDFVRSHWKNPILNYMLDKYAPVTTPQYYTDPKYSQYFAQSEYLTPDPVSESSSHKDSWNEVSSDSSQDISFQLVAKRFVKDMEPF